MADEKTTKRPWTVIDYSGDGKGWIEIHGPNGEAIATIFPFAGKGGVGREAALQNAQAIAFNGRERARNPTSICVTCGQPAVGQCPGTSVDHRTA